MSLQALKATYDHTREITFPYDWSPALDEKEKSRLEATKARLNEKLQGFYDQGFKIIHEQSDVIMGIVYRFLILGKDDPRNH
jgi:hypothetical protein